MEEFIKCSECKWCKNCPCGYSNGNSACITIQKKIDFIEWVQNYFNELAKKDIIMKQEGEILFDEMVEFLKTHSISDLLSIVRQAVFAKETDF